MRIERGLSGLKTLSSRKQPKGPLPLITLKAIRLLIAVPVVLLSVSLRTAQAEEIYCSSFPNGIVTGTVNAELIVDRDCIIASGAFIKGNVKQPDPGAAWNITVQPGAKINGNIEDAGQGTVRVRVGPGQLFNGNIKESGAGSVIVRVTDGIYDGQLEELGPGAVTIVVNGSGLFNGNAYEKDGGNLSTSGSGMYNGSTKEEGPGVCSNSITSFNGSPCE